MTGYPLNSLNNNISNSFPSPSTVAKYLFKIICILVLLNIVNIFIQHTMILDPWKAAYVDRYLNFNGENTFQSFFSTLILLFASLLLFVIYVLEKTKPEGLWKRQWFMLAVIFAFLSLDESIQIHETFTPFVQELFTGNTFSGLLYFAWIIPYSILLLLIVIYFLKFVLLQPARTRRLFFVGGFLFVGGAVGLEMVEGYVFKLYGAGHIYNDVLCCIEELLEMIGVTVFIYALVEYLSKHANVKLLVAHKAMIK